MAAPPTFDLNEMKTRMQKSIASLRDELQDMINRGGFKVFSAEVENALLANADVVDCSVVGVPDAVLGERTFALVQRRTAKLDQDQLRTYLKARIADYKVPDYWKMVDDPIPRNQNGKQQKAAVRAIAAEVLQEVQR